MQLPRVPVPAVVAALCLSLACSGPAKEKADAPRAPVADTGAGHAGKAPEAPASPAAAPAARRDEGYAYTVHGVEIKDPYHWLETLEDNAEARTWLAAEDRHARAALAAVPGRDGLIARFKELYYLDYVSPPYHRAGRYFYSRRHKDKEKAVVYWKEGEDGEEKVLFDPNTWSDDGSVSLHGYFLSWDGKKVAYKKSVNNADETTLYLRDIDTGQDSEVDVIAGTKYAGPSWTPDSKGFYYEYLPTDDSVPVAERPGRTELRYHEVGADPATDRLVFPATGDPRTFLGGGVSRDGRWLILSVLHGWNRNEVYVKDLARGARAGKRAKKTTKKKAAVDVSAMTTEERVAHHAAERGFVPMAVGKPAKFFPTWWKGHFYVYTDYQAPNYRVFKVAPRDIGKLARWREVVPESEATLDSMQIIGNHLVLPYLRDAASEIEIRDLAGKPVRKVELPGIGSSRGMLGNPDEDDAYFGFTSYTTPTQVFRTSIASGETELWSQLEVPVDTSTMTARQVRFPSRDGTEVSMFIIHRKDMKPTGDNPTILYGYGGFSVSMTPAFSSTAAVWLEHGGVYAVANLRGGGEYGEEWHKAGMLGNKQNVFDDYIAAAEYLIAEKYTSAEKLAIYGGSNGGLLVGAAMTQRPDLFRAVVCSVPLLDMVRYHEFGSGKTWIPEYGTAEDPEQFKFLHAYSPYHRVVKGTRYPALLMLTADSDDRVDPMHARKFTAAIRWATAGDGRQVLMRVEENAGHGGGDLVKKAVERSADTLAFLMWQLGV